MELSGPLWDGMAANAARELADEIEQEVAAEGKDRIVGRLAQVIRRPTPYYWTQTKNVPHPAGGRKITGEDVIYHWWLEGVGSRNSPVTRFPGYFTYRTVTPVLRSRAEAIAETIMPKFVRRMG